MVTPELPPDVIDELAKASPENIKTALKLAEDMRAGQRTAKLIFEAMKWSTGVAVAVMTLIALWQAMNGKPLSLVHHVFSAGE